MKKRDKRTNLEKEIDSVLARMAEADKLTNEYQILLEYLEKLDQVREKKEPRKKLGWDTIVIVVGGIVQTVLILNYEKINVVTSKAINFVLRGRV